MGLTDKQFERYARHLILDEVGDEGQETLLRSKVLCVGAGGTWFTRFNVSSCCGCWYYWYHR